MTYGEDLKTHLTRYKRAILEVAEDGVWTQNRRTYSHILPKARQDLNLVGPIRAECVSYVARERKKLHSDFHHLNSSQAFAFNLFYPFLAGEVADQAALLRALGLRGVLCDWDFEAVRDRRERTNFDLWLHLASGRQVFVEVKLTETQFGRARPDDVHRRRLETIYRARLAEKVAPGSLDEAAFFERYQLFRNLSYVDPPKEHEVLLVLPRSNESARLEAEAFLRDMVADSCREFIRIVHVEDVARGLESAEGIGSQQRAALQAVIEKYNLRASPVGV